MIPQEVRALRDGSCTAVYDALLTYVDRKTWECWPSADTIGAECGFSRAKVYQVLKRLESAKVVERINRTTTKGKAPTIFKLVASERLSADLDRLNNIEGSPEKAEGNPIIREGNPENEHEHRTIERKEKKVKVPPVVPTVGTRALIDAYCKLTGIERLVNYAKAGAQAKKLAEAGVTPDQLAELFEFVSEWAPGPDLGLLLNQVDRWRASLTTGYATRPDGTWTGTGKLFSQWTAREKREARDMEAAADRGKKRLD